MSSGRNETFTTTLSRRRSRKVQNLLELELAIAQDEYGSDSESDDTDEGVSMPEAHEIFNQLSGEGEEINREEFADRCSKLNLDAPEINRVFDEIDTDKSGTICATEYFKAIHRVDLLRIMHDGIRSEADVNFRIPANYDYSLSTSENYAQQSSNGVMKYSPDYQKIRQDYIDTDFHPLPTLERQRWQDATIRTMVRRSVERQPQPWIVYTCGPMGAGKGYALSWMSKHKYFPLENIVHVDPDFFKKTMPEFEEYVQRDCEAGTLCHKESGMMAEMSQELAMRNGQNVWVDGSLRDGDWYAKVLEDVHLRFPEYSIAIFCVTAREDVVRARVQERAKRIGRDVPEALIQQSLASVSNSLHKLTPLVDFVARIDNNGAVPQLVSYECVDRTGSFAVIGSRFAKQFAASTSFPRSLAPMYVMRTTLKGDNVPPMGGVDEFNIVTFCEETPSGPFSLFVRKLLETGAIARAEGVLSPPHAVNVPDEVKKELLIPSAAAMFAACSPLLGDCNKSIRHFRKMGVDVNNANVCFALYGGFLYFDQSGKLLQCNAIAGFKVDMPKALSESTRSLDVSDQKVSMLQFGSPEVIPPDVAESMWTQPRWTQARLERLSRVSNTTCDLTQHGANPQNVSDKACVASGTMKLMQTWVNPMEVLGRMGPRTKFGGFAFRLPNGAHILYQVSN